MDDIGKLLGHSNLATTVKFYANLSTKETVDRIRWEKQEKKPKSRNKLTKLAGIDINDKSTNEDRLLKTLERARKKKKT